jgi:bifunctional DNase/RNase
MVRMSVYRLGIDPSGRVLLILADEKVTRLLPLVIGQFEARAIAMELAQQRYERPLTHDLLYQVICSLGHRVDHVEVTKLEEGVFFAELNLVGGEDIVKVDSRASDAVALALRAGAPIFVAEEVLEQAAVRPQDIHVADEETGPSDPEASPEVQERLRRLLGELEIDEGSEQ